METRSIIDEWINVYETRFKKKMFSLYFTNLAKPPIKKQVYLGQNVNVLTKVDGRKNVF